MTFIKLGGKRKEPSKQVDGNHTGNWTRSGRKNYTIIWNNNVITIPNPCISNQDLHHLACFYRTKTGYITLDLKKKNICDENKYMSCYFCSNMSIVVRKVKLKSHIV